MSAARVWRLAGCCAVYLCLSGCDQSPPAGTDTSTAQAPRSVDDAINAGDDRAARLLLQPVLQADDASAENLVKAGDIEVRAGQPAKAVGYYRRAIDKTPQPPLELLDKLARLQMTLGRPYDAVSVLRKSIRLYPDNTALRTDTAGLLASLGLNLESSEHLRWLVQRGKSGVGELVILTDLARPQTDVAMCEDALRRNPLDQRPNYALGILDLYEQKWTEAKQKFTAAIATHPNFVPAWAGLVRCDVELDDASAVAESTRDLPAEIADHPQYWIAAGVWANNHQDDAGAVDALTRAAKLNADDGEILNRLAAALAKSNSAKSKSADSKRPGDSALIAKRAQRLSKLRDAVDGLFSWRNNSQRSAVEIAHALDELGRRWEAVAWLRVGSMMTQDPDSRLRATYEAIVAKLDGSTPWQTPAELPHELIAESNPLESPAAFRWAAGSPPVQPSEFDAALPTTARMVDEANRRGLNHECKIDAAAGGDWMIFQSGSGGLAVIDFDRDGWQDLYLTTADGQPRQSDSETNRLFRNRDGQFSGVTAESNSIEHGFSQGVAAGDVNSDGFSDLYIANIGRNRLLVNNGDGTFSRHASPMIRGNPGWTSSVAIADINGDGTADLYDVGYCAGEAPYQQKCIDKEIGESRTCQPLVFQAQSDRVLSGRPDGTFEESTDDWLGDGNEGHGLGVVIGRLDGDETLDVYVANDMTANNFWSRSTGDGPFRLTDQAAIRGLAFNARSLSQASMGIAAGDPDNDGDFDLFLTHFTDDHNTFYENVGDGLWVDQSRPSGLAQPSQAMLGFGTQWIDLENDGGAELIVTNGHVDNFTHQDLAFRMPAQVFDAAADDRWRQLDGDVLGDYFQRQLIGRAMIIMDANRDGRTDAAVTHLFDPVALLINSTLDAGSSVSFHLTATDSHRDAVGAIIKVTTDAGTVFAQRFAGNGYQCSSEQCIRVGVGAATSVSSVRIQWPSGTVESFADLVPGAEYAVVEGDGQPFMLATPTHR